MMAFSDDPVDDQVREVPLEHLADAMMEMMTKCCCESFRLQKLCDLKIVEVTASAPNGYDVTISI
jgi:hypothetical protein